MKENQLQRFDKDGIEIIINTDTGESFATIRGYARMSGKPYSTIQSRTSKLTGDGALKEAQILTPQGLQGGRLLTENHITEWLIKDNPETAKKLFKLGVRVFMHKLAGYEVSSTALGFKIPKTYGEALLEAGRLAIENEKLQAQLEAEAPLVKLAETLTVKDKDTVSIGELAKSYEIGRTTFFKQLRQIGFIMQAPSRLPYQVHIDAKRAEVVRKERPTQDGIFDAVTVVTAKGQEYIANKLVELDRLEQAEVLMEAAVTLRG